MNVVPRRSSVFAVLLALVASLAVVMLPSSAMAAARGTISGRITALDGSGVSRGYVHLEQSDDASADGWFEWGEVRTSSDGTYSAAVPAGTYRVSVDGPGGDTHYYDGGEGTGEATAAQSVDVVAGTSTTGIDITAQVNPLSGRVVDPDGVGIGNAWIEVYQHVTDGSQTTWEWYDSLRSEANGDFVDFVEPGTYRIRFRGDNRRGYVGEFYDDVASLRSAKDVIVGDQTGADLGDVTLDRMPGIYGHVDLPGGASRTDEKVQLLDSKTGEVLRRFSGLDANGNYAFAGLEAGSYKVSFDRLSGQAFAAPQYFDGTDEADSGQAKVVDLGDGDVQTGVDAALDEGGTITGRLVDGEATPLAYCTLQAYTPDNHLVTRTGHSDDDGTFTVSGLSTGDYELRVIQDGDCDGGTQVYVGDGAKLATSGDKAVAVHVVVGQPTAMTADLVYTHGASISGTVTYPAGSTGHDHNVQVVDANGRVAGHAHVASDGTYTVTGLLPDTYRVQFDRLSGTAFAEAQFFDDQPESAGPQSASGVSVALGEHKAGIDAALVEGGHITGVLTDGNGAPLACRVQAYTADGHFVTRSAMSSGEDGSFTIGGLTTGDYRVNVVPEEWGGNGCDNGDQFWTGTGQPLSPDAGQGVTVPVTAGQGKDIGVLAYEALARISGTVTFPAGSTGHDHNVSVLDTDGNLVKKSRVNRDGTYSLSGLQPGSYRVQFDRLSGTAFAAAQFFDHVAEQDGSSASSVDLQPGEARTGIDADLQAGGVIDGTLVDSTGSPLASCTVQAYTTDDHLVTRSAWTDESGQFAVGGLASGDYSLRVLPDGEQCDAGTQYYVSADGNLASNGAPLAISVVQGAVKTVASQLVYGPSASISGTIDFPAGYEPSDYYADELVDVYDLTTGKHVSRGWVDSGTGSYSVQGLASGSYRVEFARASGTALAAAQFYNGHAESEGPGVSDAVTLTAGEHKTGVDAALAMGGAITGTALTSNDRPAFGCEVQAFTPDGSLVTRMVHADRNGHFKIGGLSTGAYRIAMNAVYDPLYLASDTGAMSESVGDAIAVHADLGGVTKLSAPLHCGLPAPIANVALPTVSGQAQVGQQLTADAGTWTPADATFTYQWLADGTAVDGATTRSYALTAADLGKAMSVRVTASAPGRPDVTAESAATGPVAKGTITNGTQPSLTGTPKVGAVLTASAGSWTPAGVTLGYQWLVDGTAVDGANGATYTPVPGDVGKTVKVRVTAVKDGYESASRDSAATTPVGKGDLSYSTSPSVTGTAMVGETLTAEPGSWTPSDATFSYQWLASGNPIAGATGKTLALTADQVGMKVSVQVTASRTGYNDKQVVSGTTSAVVAKAVVITNAVRPAVSGTPKVGVQLTASAGTWAPAGVSLAYQWFRGATAISGATARTYAPVAGDVGQALHVRVTASRTGSASLSAVSADTAAVAKGTLVGARPRISGKLKVGKVLAARRGTWQPAGVTFRYQWYRNGVKIRKATKAKYKLTRKDKRKHITVRVTGRMAGYATLSKTSVRTKAIRR